MPGVTKHIYDRDIIDINVDDEEDLEDLGINADKMEREKLTRGECNSIYLASTEIINDFNKIKQGKEIKLETLKKLKEEAEKEIILFSC